LHSWDFFQWVIAGYSLSSSKVHLLSNRLAHRCIYMKVPWSRIKLLSMKKWTNTRFSSGIRMPRHLFCCSMRLTHPIRKVNLYSTSFNTSWMIFLSCQQGISPKHGSISSILWEERCDPDGGLWTRPIFYEDRRWWMTSIFHSKAHQEAHTIISHLKTTITVLLTSNTIITVKTQILDILIIVTRYANIARRRTTLRLSAIASNHKQTILLVTTKQILSIKSCLL